MKNSKINFSYFRGSLLVKELTSENSEWMASVSKLVAAFEKDKKQSVVFGKKSFVLSLCSGQWKVDVIKSINSLLSSSSVSESTFEKRWEKEKVKKRLLELEETEEVLGWFQSVCDLIQNWLWDFISFISFDQFEIFSSKEAGREALFHALQLNARAFIAEPMPTNLKFLEAQEWLEAFRENVFFANVKSIEWENFSGDYGTEWTSSTLKSVLFQLEVVLPIQVKANLFSIEMDFFSFPVDCDTVGKRRKSIVKKLARIPMVCQSQFVPSVVKLNAISKSVKKEEEKNELSLIAKFRMNACPNCGSGSHILTFCADDRKCFACGDPSHQRGKCSATQEVRDERMKKLLTVFSLSQLN